MTVAESSFANGGFLCKKLDIYIYIWCYETFGDVLGYETLRCCIFFTDPSAVTVLKLDAGSRTLKRKKWACKALVTKGDEGTDRLGRGL